MHDANASRDPRVEVRIIKGPDAPICVLTPSGDFTSAAPLEDAVSETITLGVRDIAIDLRAVSAFSREALDVLQLARKRCARRDGTLVLVRPAPGAFRMLVETGLTDAFPAFVTERTAVEYLRARAGLARGRTDDPSR